MLTQFLAAAIAATPSPVPSETSGWNGIGDPVFLLSLMSAAGGIILIVSELMVRRRGADAGVKLAEAKRLEAETKLAVEDEKKAKVEVAKARAVARQQEAALGSQLLAAPEADREAIINVFGGTRAALAATPEPDDGEGDGDGADDGTGNGTITPATVPDNAAITAIEKMFSRNPQLITGAALLLVPIIVLSGFTFGTNTD